jgi:hypothetical protein
MLAGDDYARAKWLGLIASSMSPSEQTAMGTTRKIELGSNLKPAI